MAQWDQQFVEYLKRAGEDLKRTGEELRKEAHRVMEEVRDPDTQAKIKSRLNEFGTWAKKTAEEAAGMIETAVKKAEGAVREAVKPETTEASAAPKAAPKTAPKAAPKTAPKPAAAAKPAPARRVTKTVGPKKAGGSRKPGIGTAKAKKTVGRKK